MKIGILTFHCAHNYGAVLQCYALQEILKSSGHDVEIIDYRPNYLINPYKVFYIRRFISHSPIKIIKAWINEFLIIKHRMKRYQAFQSFIDEKFNLSRRIEKKNIPSDYDYYVIGSDQIWNPQITLGFDSVYFACFEFPKNNKKYISYAASMETSMLNDKEKDFYKQMLKNFDAISVRENNLAKLLQPLTNIKVETVLDPTLLADSSIWNSLAKQPTINKKYVLIYQVRADKNTRRIAQLIAKQLHIEVVEITSWASCRFIIKNHTYQSCSPKEFLGWIKNANCVVTTSFHGTAFSIIFNKSFYSLKLGKGDTRTLSILQNIQLESRMIDKTSSPTFQDIDYETPNKLLANLRMQSQEYLLSALK